MIPLHGAAYNNSKECLELLLSYGADVNVKNIVSKDNNMKLTDRNNNYEDYSRIILFLCLYFNRNHICF